MMIEVENLSFEYSDGTRALSNINLTIRSEETTIIAGANGSGKSTLARHLNGLYHPDEGTVWVKGVSTEQDGSHAREHVGMVFQNPDDQIAGMTVRDDVAFGPENLGLPEREIEKRVEKALRTMKLSGLEDKSPHLLSGGQKKRLAIAGVLAMKPDCILLDEPLSGLDYPSRKSLLSELSKLKSRGYTLIITCTNLEDVWSLADRLIILEDGTVRRKGNPTDLIFRGVEDLGVREPSVFKVVRVLEKSGLMSADLDAPRVARLVRGIYEGERVPIQG